MRPDRHWRVILRAWTALIIAVAHLLLALSTNVTRAAPGPAAHDVGALNAGTMFCLPSGHGGSPEAPAKPVSDNHNDCCTSCTATGPVAVSAPFAVATAIPVTASAADIRYAAPFLLDTIDCLPGFARAPPAAA
jgi:hypothetical protein